MNVQHKELAAGRWATMPFREQMGNIGSEISRALNWRAKGNDDLSEKALNRALELLYLAIESADTHPRLRELTRLRECLLDFFHGSNEYSSTEKSWRKYFDSFGYAARKNR